MSFVATTLMTLLLLTGILLMFIVLLQRGRGGGLAGAFGGLGGQSAFGTKAGDVFTKITIVVAVLWVLLAAFAGLAMRQVNLFASGAAAPPTDPTITAGEGDEVGEKDATPAVPDKTDPDEEDNPFPIIPAPGEDDDQPGDGTDTNSNPKPPAETDPKEVVDPDMTTDEPKSDDTKPVDPEPTPADTDPADESAPTENGDDVTKPGTPGETPTGDQPAGEALDAPQPE